MQLQLLATRARWLLPGAALALLLAAAIQQWRSPSSSAGGGGSSSSSSSSAAEQALVDSPPSPFFCSRARPPFVCAHGGDASRKPPNTAAAYAAALDARADCIEVDVSLTADGRLASLHDRDLQALLGQPDATVSQYNLAQLTALAWPSGERVLAVEQALAAVCPASSIELLILDVKTPGPAISGGSSSSSQDGDAGNSSSEALLVQLLLAALAAQQGCAAKSLVWAKSDALVQRVKQAAPAQRVGYTVMLAPGTPHEQPLRMAEPEVAAVFHGMLDARLLSRLRAANKSVHAWTANAPRHLGRLLDLGVDGLVTNVPGLAAAAVRARTHKCAAAAGAAVELAPPAA